MPVPRRGVVRALFALIQVMYLIFYVSGLAHLHDAERVASSFLPGWRARSSWARYWSRERWESRCGSICCPRSAFDFRRLALTFGRLFPFVLALDEIWAITPFLLLPQIGVGLAFAATARFALRALFGENSGANGVSDLAMRYSRPQEVGVRNSGGASQSDACA